MDRDPRLDPAPAAPAPGPLRVLVVDDNADGAEALAAFLEIEGCDVRVATDPMQALELLAAFAPHVAVLDIGLPQMDGYELAERIRETDGRPRLPAHRRHRLRHGRRPGPQPGRPASRRISSSRSTSTRCCAPCGPRQRPDAAR